MRDIEPHKPGRRGVAEETDFDGGLVTDEEETMRRTKEWWAALEPEERSKLVALEQGQATLGGGTGWNLPEGYSSCQCGYPKRGRGLCPLCRNRLQELRAKADRAMERRKETHAQEEV